MEQMVAGQTRARLNLALPKRKRRVNEKFIVDISPENFLGALTCFKICWLEAPQVICRMADF